MQLTVHLFDDLNESPHDGGHENLQIIFWLLLPTRSLEWRVWKAADSPRFFWARRLTPEAKNELASGLRFSRPINHATPEAWQKKNMQAEGG